MKLRALIVDDDWMAREWLRALIAREPEVEIVSECDNGAAAVDLVRRLSPDVVFMDIQMPGMSGLEAVDRIQPIAQPAIVFVTGFDKYAVHAFEACALDYLLKPVESERLTKTLQRVRNYLSVSMFTALPEAATSAVRFCVRSGQRTSFIAPGEIDWIEADGNYAIFHVGEQKHLYRQTMAFLELQLPPVDFVRVSRSAIVPLGRIREIQTAPGGHNFALLKDGQKIPVTRSAHELITRLRLRLR